MFILALHYRGRYLWLWITALLYGLVTESVSFKIPDVNNFWHYQTTVMFLHQRLPIYILCFCKYMEFCKSSIRKDAQKIYQINLLCYHQGSYVCNVYNMYVRHCAVLYPTFRISCMVAYSFVGESGN